ncbi:Endonuclease/exonuclease/phosphatase [Trema orientale]|uniref:Endonuclease/exonuclease/phosphatase n=1 Tax=Trema orientale TaxID=63057 RepID=A0A2P5ERK3_TREOI|nr:Endonuclease/exonuclease/phosphatase [Trema orientale]
MCVWFPPVGRSEGLCVAWKEGVELEPHFCSKNIISYIVYSDPLGVPWSFSMVYGPPATSLRRDFWNAVPSLLAQTPNAKLLIGDCNGTLLDCESWSSIHTHRGSSSCSGAMHGYFNEMGVLNLGFSGPSFTWNRRRGGVLFSRARLASVEWCSLFPQARVLNITDSVSDHCSILLNTDGEGNLGFKPFQFEAMWTLDVRSHWIVT